jgi:hypothetical protein
MSDKERRKSGNPGEPCWFDTLPPIPEKEIPRIDALIKRAFDQLREDVARGRVRLPGHPETKLVKTTEVASGVTCDSYVIEGDPTQDLGVIMIEPGCATPKQRVVKGEKTIEGYISGRGKLIVTKENGTTETYKVGDKGFEIDIEVGEVMQWQADPNSNLTVYEVCIPPYEDGRFENL